MHPMAMAAADNSASIPWLGPTAAVVTVLFGSGGVIAWLRYRYDRRIGVAQQETAEDDALANRWKAIIQTQTESLLEPMQKELTTAKNDLAEMKRDMQSIRVELEMRTRKYWSAIMHIRTMYTWIARQMPEAQVPEPPTIIAEDV